MYLPINWGNCLKYLPYILLAHIPLVENNHDSMINRKTIVVLFFLFVYYFLFPQRTFHVPDEYYQSLEIIHHMFHGYGIRSWEWFIGLRSYASVLYYAFIYYIYKYVFGGESVEQYLKWCGVIVAMVTLYFGIELWSNSTSASDKKGVVSNSTSDINASNHNVLIIQDKNWNTYLPWILASFIGFWIFVSRRSITNSLEMMFTTISLHFFLRHNPNFFWYWFFAGIGCLSRPTNAVVHLFVCLYILIQSRFSWREKFRFLRHAFFLTIFWIGFMTLIDRYFYGKWVFSIYEFLKFNVLDGNASMYGVHPWHWYISQGIPVLMLTLLIPFLYMHYKCLIGEARERDRFSIALFWWTTICFSLLPHKEFRFLLPVYPLAINTSLQGIRPWLQNIKWKWNTILLLSILIIPNLAFGIFFNLIQQKGAIEVMYFLKQRNDQNPGSVTSIYFLMPCHHTPGYFYMHSSENAPPKIFLRHLDCSPPHMESDLTREQDYSNRTLPSGEYLHETRLFYQDPFTFTKKLFDYHVPTHIVMYESMADKLGSFLSLNYDFEEIVKLHHMYFSEVLDDNMSDYIKVFERK